MNRQRNRAWRRLQKKINRGKGMGSNVQFKPEKKCKLTFYARKNCNVPSS